MIKKLLHNIFKLFSFLFLRRREIPIVYYHDIVPDGQGYSFQKTDFSVFKKHMQYLIENEYKSITFSQIPDSFKKNKNDKLIMIQFDDGYISNHSMIYNYMESNNIRYNIFLTVGCIEKNNPDYLSWNLIRKISESRLVEFGAHTYSHIDSRLIDENNYHVEISKSNSIIYKNTGVEVSDFCFPFGNYDKKTLQRFCKFKCYKRLYTSDNMKVKKLYSCLIRGRSIVGTNDSVNDFARKVKGYHNIFYYMKYFRRINTIIKKYLEVI